jgi:hypothetical protein
MYEVDRDGGTDSSVLAIGIQNSTDIVVHGTPAGTSPAQWRPGAVRGTDSAAGHGSHRPVADLTAQIESAKAEATAECPASAGDRGCDQLLTRPGHNDGHRRGRRRPPA